MSAIDTLIYSTLEWPVLVLLIKCTITYLVFKTLLDCTSKLRWCLSWFIAFGKPLNYEKDMTVKNHCKSLAEIDNSLKYRSRVAVESAKHGSADATRGHDRTTDATHEDIRINESYNCGNTEQSEGEFIYPNGWLPVIESQKVKPSSIERAIIVGRDVIVTRSNEGKISVMDAYCPHLGVNIGVGGKVLRVDDESCVQCPFHGWTFSARDGQCVKIPYSSARPGLLPKQAKLKVWESVEIDNFIYVWHHIDEQPPTWHLKPTEELASGDMIFAGRSCHTTNLELRDMHENGADLNHFEAIHNDLFLFGGEYLKVQAYEHLQKYFRHRWDSPNWRPVVDAKAFDIEIQARQTGPAHVSLRYDSPYYGRGILTMNAVPLGGRRTLYIQHIYTRNRWFDFLMGKCVLYGEVKQLERDLFMWNHKKNIKNPVFIQEDKSLKQLRVWYAQFYKRRIQITTQDSKENQKPKVGILGKDCNKFVF